jgi:hypothetical protein
VRLVGVAVSSLAILAILRVASLAIWLQTAAGRGWVARALIRATSERLALTLSVGRIGGNMIRDIRLERIALYDGKGRLVARADVLSARYRLQQLIRHHTVDGIVIVRPVIARLPGPAAPSAPGKGDPATLSLPSLTIIDGSFSAHGVHHVSANLAIDLGRSGARVEGQAKLMVDERPLFLRARAERDGARVRVSAELLGAGFDARGRGDWVDGRLTANLDALDVEPPLVEAVHPWAGRGTLHAHGTLVGPLDALDLAVQGHTDDVGIALRTRIDVPRKTARLRVGVVSPLRSAHVRADGALRGRTLDLSAIEANIGATRLTGAARYTGGSDAQIDATLAARVAPAEAAVIRIHPAGPIRLQVTLQGSLRAVDVRVAGRLGVARVALGGFVDLPARRGRVRFVAHDLRPSDIVPNAPPLVFSGVFAFKGEVREGVGLAGKLSISDGRLQIAGLHFDRMRGSSQVRLGRSGEARVEALSGRLAGRHPRPIDLRTVVRWNSRSLRFDTPHAIVDGSSAAGEVVFTHDPITRKPRIVARAERLSVSPALVQEVFHRRSQRPWPGRATLVWMPNDFRIGFALDTDQGPASGEAQLRQDQHGALEAPRIVVAWGGSRFSGAARLKGGELVASIDELLLQPELVHSLWPALNPARALRVEGALAGPPSALEIRLLATAGPGTAMVRGHVDLRARSFSLLGTIDTFEPAQLEKSKSGRVTLELAVMGRVVEGGVAGTLTVRHATGTIQRLPVTRAILDAHLDGPKFHVERILMEVPGAVVDAKGGGTYRDFRIGFGVLITNALALKSVPSSLRLIVGLTTLFPGYAVKGSIQRHNGGKIVETHRTIPPGLRWLSLLWELLRGRVPHFTVP